MSNNNVKDWGEFSKLAELRQLENLLFVGQCNTTEERFTASAPYIPFLCHTQHSGNPLEEKHSAEGQKQKT